MLETNPWQELIHWFNKNRIWLSICLLGCGLTISGGSCVYLFLLSSPAVIPAISRPSSSYYSIPTSTQFLTVTIAGAIEKPGVYRVPSTYLMADLIKQAGGFSEVGDRAAIAQTINLASNLTDQQQIYIPVKGLNFKAEITSSGKQTTPLLSISINTASASELETLEGIGAKRAQDIINNRPYFSINDLVAKEILTANQLAKIGELISL